MSAIIQLIINFCFVISSYECYRSSNPSLNCLPQKWLQEALDLCTGEKQSDKLCATRRSAGLPYLILVNNLTLMSAFIFYSFQSVLSLDPTFSKPKFNHTFATLAKISGSCNPTDKEYRIHSLNIMRNMFRHTHLREIVAPYVGKAVIIAIRNFTVEDWSVSDIFYYISSMIVTI